MILQHTGHAKSIRATIRHATGARSKVVNMLAEAKQACSTPPHALSRQVLQLNKCAMQAVGVQPPPLIRAGANRASPRHPPSAILSTALDALDLPGRRASLRAARRYADESGQGRGSEARSTCRFAPTAASGSQTPGDNLPSSIERDGDLRARATGDQSG
jgi:hypothetical protein